MAMLIGMALAVAAATASEPPKGPAEAIELADGHPGRGTTGVFRMTVAAASRGAHAVYLNSSQDYRAPDDLTFELSLPAAKTLEKRLGAKPEAALVGRVVTVRGAVQNATIVNTVAGRPRSFNRYQHRVLVRQADQLTVE